MTASTTIRFSEAERRHAAALAALASETFHETFGHLYPVEDLNQHLQEKCSVEFFEQSLAQGDFVLLAYDGDQIVGYCKAGDVTLPIAHPPHKAQEIHRLYVRKEYHSRGLGQELLTRALHSKRLKEAPLVYLSVWEENDKAKSFYYKNGFLPVGRYLYPVGNQQDQEMILVRVNALN
jgi:ribosomal protein S18 acetylase RimI-like enzyme